MLWITKKSKTNYVRLSRQHKRYNQLPFSFVKIILNRPHRFVLIVWNLSNLSYLNLNQCINIELKL